ncbi:MAG: ATP-binding protein [Desulfobulbus sp.]|nr:ATP-binding protein [Desulfobulbus sp.]
MKTTVSGILSRRPLYIAALYLAVAVFWILFSDSLVNLLIDKPELFATTAPLIKNWLFVLVTACLLYVALQREIATCREAMEHLQKSRQELLDMLDAMPVGIILINGKAIEYININFSEQFGYSIDEIPTDIQWSMLAYPDPAYREKVIAMRWSEIERFRQTGLASRPFEVKVTCKDGQVRHVIVNAQLINSRVMTIFTDITEREILHSELVKMQKLESIGALAGGLAHEFNNILTGIMGNLSYARMVLEPAHAVHQTLDLAESATRRATELTGKLLTFSRGGYPVKKVMAVRFLIDEAAKMMLRGTNVRAEIQVEEAVRLIEADAGQMAQVLHNLIANAVQAMPEGGTLRISADNARLDAGNAMALDKGDYVRIVVADEGEGIPEAIRGRIFDPFFTTKGTGSGLGLAAAYSIINRHGGYIGLDPAAGKGTVCTIFLPATDKPLPEIPSACPADDSRDPHDSPACELRKSAVLVMDDEMIIRKLITAMLNHLGYEARTCADGEEAVRLYTEALEAGAPFAMVIMDLTIPGSMGGLEAARHILAMDANACLVVSSGYSNDPVMAEYQTHGFAGALAKPYTMTSLRESLDAVLATVSC